MGILSNKTSSNPNASLDINTLSDRAFDKQGTGQIGSLTEETSPENTDLLLLEKGDSTQALKKVQRSALDKNGITFCLRGNAYVGTKQAQILMPFSATISKVIAYVDTAPDGADLQVDINKNGVTIFTTQGNRPIIADGTNTDDSGTPDVTSLVQDDRISVDVDQVGSTTAGGNDLLITIVFA